MWRFLFTTVLMCLAFFSISQKKEAMEYVIKDSLTLKQYKSRIPSLVKSNKIAEVAHINKLIADYYYVKWQHDSLLSYYKKAMQQYEVLNDSFYICYCRFRIGETIAKEGNNPDESIAWHLPGTHYFERSKEYHMAAYANYAVSTMYKAKGQIDLRNQYLDKAIELNKIAKDTLLTIIILNEKNREQVVQKKWNDVVIGANNIIELSRRIRDSTFIKVGLVQLSNALMSLGKYAEAIPHLEESATISNVTREAIYETHRMLTICYLRLNRNKEAERSLALYKHTSDSITKMKAGDDYQKLLVQFETDKKQATIAALQTENKLKSKLSRTQQMFIILLGAGLGVVLGGVWAFRRNIKKRRVLEKELQNEKESKMSSDFNKQLAEVQLTALSAQMNPHFIFNCMNSIQKYILKNEKAKALEFLQNFSDLMRRVLDNSVKSKVSLDEEINMLEKYIMLEKQRLDDQFDYTIEIATDLQADFFEIPGMVIQPYIENAIWHGLMNKNEKGNLMLKFEKQNGFIKCIVEDNGVGRKKAAEIEQYKSPKHKSYGMAIAKQRLELLQRENEDVPEIIIEDMENEKKEALGTKVTIFIHVD